VHQVGNLYSYIDKLQPVQHSPHTKTFNVLHKQDKQRIDYFDNDICT